MSKGKEDRVEKELVALVDVVLLCVEIAVVREWLNNLKGTRGSLAATRCFDRMRPVTH